jgi:hypothetical protein
MLRNLILGMALVAIMLTSSHAFTAPGIITTTSSASTSALGLFGFIGRNDQNPKATTPKGGSKSKQQEEEPKKPFIFLYGKPQYDWVKGKPMEKKAKAEFSWYSNPKPTTPKKK